MKKWLTGLLSAALLAGNLPVYPLNTAYAAEEDGFFTDETYSFEGGSQESEDTQSEDSFASVSEFTGFTSGEAEEDFSGEEDFEASDSQEGFEGETDPIIMPETDAQDEGGYLQNLTLYTSQSGASTVGLKRMSDLDAEFGGKVYVVDMVPTWIPHPSGSQRIWQGMHRRDPSFSWKPRDWTEKNRMRKCQKADTQMVPVTI